MRRWILRGVVWKSGRQLKVEERSVEISSEEDLDRHEAKLRSDLAEYVMSHPGDSRDVRIEIENDLE